MNNNLGVTILDDDKDIDMDLSIIEREELKRNIFAELDDIDRKSVRALRENNKELLERYETRAQELRTQLQSIS